MIRFARLRSLIPFDHSRSLNSLGADSGAHAWGVEVL